LSPSFNIIYGVKFIVINTQTIFQIKNHFYHFADSKVTVQFLEKDREFLSF